MPRAGGSAERSRVGDIARGCGSAKRAQWWDIARGAGDVAIFKPRVQDISRGARLGEPI